MTQRRAVSREVIAAVHKRSVASTTDANGVAKTASRTAQTSPSARAASVALIVLAVFVFGKPAGGLSAFQYAVGAFIVGFGVRFALMRVRSGVDAVEYALMAVFVAAALSWAFSEEVPFRNVQILESRGQNTGHLDMRLRVHGVLALVTCAVGYRLGRLIGSGNARRRAPVVLLAVLSANAAWGAVRWIEETGGVIARYNWLPREGSQIIHLILCGIGTLIALALVADKTQSLSTRLFGWSALPILVVGWITVLSRIGIVTIVLGIVVFVATGAGSWLRRAGVLVLLVVATLVVGGAFLAYSDPEVIALFGALVNRQSEDVSIRMQLLTQAIAVIRENPMFGVGFGFSQAYIVEPIRISGADVSVASSHNGIATVLLQTGAVGLIAYIGVVRLVFRTFRRYRHSGSATGEVMCRLGYALLVIEVASAVSGASLLLPTPEQWNTVQLAFVFWYLIGLSSGIARQPFVARRSDVSESIKRCVASEECT